MSFRKHFPGISGTLPYILFFLLLAVTAVVRRHWLEIETKQNRTRYDESCEHIISKLQDSLDSHSMQLSGAAAVFAASENVTRTQWRQYYEYRASSKRYPGRQAFAFVRKVSAPELEAHVQAIRAEGFPDYQVTPAGEREVYFPVVYVEPFNEVNRRAFGFDVFSEPVRRDAMLQAMKSANTTMSGRLILATDTDAQQPAPGFVMCLPIYSGGPAPETWEERQTALQGFVIVGFRIKEFIRGIFPKPSRNAYFELYDDVDDSADSMPVYSNRTSAPPGHNPLFACRKLLDLHGRQWIVHLSSTPEFEAEIDRLTPWLITFSGILIAVLVFMFTRA